MSILDASFMFGGVQISLAKILSSLMWLAFAVFLSVWLSSWLEKRLMRVEHLDMSLRMVVSKVLRTVLIALSILMILPTLGINLSALTVFGGTLGVGLGFGLQKIASNYISGFIILLDRSIRIGDRLVIGDRTGQVTRITSRYTVLRTLDGTEALIPNDTLVSNVVINQSYSDDALWVSVPVQVAYGTDLHFILEQLPELIKDHPRIAKDPDLAPCAYITRFADSGIDVELAFWVLDPSQGFLSLRSEINMAIWSLFQEHHIEIPFPKRDIYVHSQATPIRLGVDSQSRS